MTIRRLTLLCFFLALESLIYLVSQHVRGLEISVLIALPFASSMAARAISYLDVFEWLRHPFTTVTPHSSGAGDSVNPKDGPVTGVIGGLLSCINCSGMWASVGMLALYIFEPAFGRLMIYALAATTLGVILTRSIEAIEWIGHAAHELAGMWNAANKAGVVPQVQSELAEQVRKAFSTAD